MTAELLRYVYPLQISPWSPPEQPDQAFLNAVRIAHPVAYLFQKILVNRRRRRGKDANDLLYVADTAEVFGDRLDALREEWLGDIGPQIHPNHIKKFRREAAALTTPSDVHVAASKIAESIARSLAPERLAQVVRVVVERVFPEGPFESLPARPR